MAGGGAGRGAARPRHQPRMRCKCLLIPTFQKLEKNRRVTLPFASHCAALLCAPCPIRPVRPGGPPLGAIVGFLEFSIQVTLRLGRGWDSFHRLGKRFAPPLGKEGVGDGEGASCATFAVHSATFAFRRFANARSSLRLGWGGSAFSAASRSHCANSSATQRPTVALHRASMIRFIEASPPTCGIPGHTPYQHPPSTTIRGAALRPIRDPRPRDGCATGAEASRAHP